MQSSAKLMYFNDPELFFSLGQFSFWGYDSRNHQRWCKVNIQNTMWNTTVLDKTRKRLCLFKCIEILTFCTAVLDHEFIRPARMSIWFFLGGGVFIAFLLLSCFGLVSLFGGLWDDETVAACDECFNCKLTWSRSSITSVALASKSINPPVAKGHNDFMNFKKLSSNSWLPPFIRRREIAVLMVIGWRREGGKLFGFGPVVVGFLATSVEGDSFVRDGCGSGFWSLKSNFKYSAAAWPPPPSSPLLLSLSLSLPLLASMSPQL